MCFCHVAVEHRQIDQAAMIRLERDGHVVSEVRTPGHPGPGSFGSEEPKSLEEVPEDIA